MVWAGVFFGTRVMEIVKKHDSGGLVWKRIKLTTTRKANGKKRLLRDRMKLFSRHVLNHHLEKSLLLVLLESQKMVAFALKANMEK